MKFEIDTLGVFLKVIIRVNKVTFAPLVVSTLFILLTCLLAHSARKLVARLKSGTVQTLLYEAIATAELCGCCFELIVVAENFGVFSYGAFLFALSVWWSLNWESASACPYTNLEDYVDGKHDVRVALLKTWAQLGGGLAVYKYVQLYWALEIIDAHKDKVTERCMADLQVPALYGALVEGVGTCLCRLSTRVLGDLNPRYANAIDAFTATSLVVAAFDYTGGYYNPALATALKFGCRGHTLLEHIAVYWVGACAGALISNYVYKMPAFKRLFKGSDSANGDVDSIWGDKEE